MQPIFRSDFQVDPVVTVTQGQLKGAVKSLYDGSKYFSFKGIPYAEPPVGELRFKVGDHFMKNFYLMADLWPPLRLAVEENLLMIVFSSPGPTATKAVDRCARGHKPWPSVSPNGHDHWKPDSWRRELPLPQCVYPVADWQEARDGLHSW